eukprot:gnl/MRDRNA2_/MRDRNA2_132268_c0_seq1.p1 gnl/MRDRNA2_/MRDRNA2_132268_c0~~gnl/MRDRNA2_/MRDRNA2_132268_c0_seq1.p1  ORF type:complete len:134 (+),score=18.15 gnl/MRDRNA2_/MRDRNA2_132268_c0_seq1:97-498(+)
MRLLFLLHGVFALHYEKPPCGSDEVQAELQGTTARILCAPECTSSTCPEDVPHGVTANPECVLEDLISGKKYCGLACASTNQCAPGASCTKVTLLTGICTFPESSVVGRVQTKLDVKRPLLGMITKDKVNIVI